MILHLRIFLVQSLYRDGCLWDDLVAWRPFYSMSRNNMAKLSKRLKKTWKEYLDVEVVR